MSCGFFLPEEEGLSSRFGHKSVTTAANLANSLWMQELIDKGQHILQDDS